MKNLKIKIVYLIVLLGFISCDDQLDLVPTDILVEQSVFADIETAESALSDVYHKLFVASTGGTHVIADASLDYVGLQDNSPYYNYTGENLTATEYEVERIWQRYYEVINVANVFIDKVPVYGNYNETVELQHVAEAKFNRAYAYWMLLCYYGHGSLIGNSAGLCVPLQLKPYNGFNAEDVLERSTNETVYNQIIQDLTEAIIDLPILQETHLLTRARATKASAQAMLSRVQLYNKNYQASIDAADEVFSNGNYMLDSNLLNLFPANNAGNSSSFSSEVIFGFPVSSNNGNFQFGTHTIYYRNKYQYVASSFINSMDENDKRRTELIYEGNPFITNPFTKFEKATFKFNNPDQRDDIKVIRLAEVILNKAEALAEINGVNNESVTLLNQIRVRSGINSYDLIDFSSKQDLLDAIHHERIIEFAFEGRGRFDNIRTGRPLRNPNLSEDLKTLPIPQREIDLSEGTLVQNPGY